MKIHMTGEWFHTLPDGRTSVRYRRGVTYEVDDNVGEMAIAAGRAALVADSTGALGDLADEPVLDKGHPSTL